MAVTLNTNFSMENFSALDIEKKRALYQKANEEENIELVRQLNQLGMKPEVPPILGPSIISNLMDVATKYDILLQYFKNLRQTNRLFKEKEFENLSDKKWRQKYNFSRLLGCDHMAKKISELHLTRIKVPTKVMVVEAPEHLQVEAWDPEENGKLFEIRPKQIKIYAEEIESVDRKLTRNEIDEIIQIIASANFTDMHAGQLIVAKDGIYFIDTEFRSFEGSINWAQVGSFYVFVAEEDKSYFLGKLKEKDQEPFAPIEYTGYYALKNMLTGFKDVAAKYDILLQYFKDLRQTNRFLTEKEFENLSDKNWRQTYYFSRLLRSDHLAKKISELHLTRIKVPTQVLVVEASEHLQVEAWNQDTKGQLFEIHPEKQIKIYAEEIESEDRKLTRKEIDELIQIIASANYTNLHAGQLIVAKDGIYFIDTEFSSFEGPINWGKVGRFDVFVAEEDKSYFHSKVQEKMEEPFAPIKYSAYYSPTNMLSKFITLPKQSKAEISSRFLKMKQTISNLEYVGAKKVGAKIGDPNHFSFPMSEILG